MPESSTADQVSYLTHCNFCNEFQPHENSQDERVKIGSWQSAQNRADRILERNCQKCSLLEAVSERVEQSLGDGTQPFQFCNNTIWARAQPNGLVVVYFLWRRKSGKRSINDTIQAFATLNDVAEQTLCPRVVPVPGWPDYENISCGTLNFLKKRLKDCEFQEHLHHDCPGGQAESVLPTRLVYIGGDMNPIKLHEPKPGKKGVYVALSHCWGAKDSRPMQTTVDNLNEMKSNIKWEDLSPVFQDSIWLCRRLGVEFLWIDSLCIIQGDEQDWERESSMMAQYYSHARFTIAVESSPNGKVSFLKERQLRWQAQIYPVTDRSGVERRYSVQEHYHLIGLLPDEINRYFKEGKKLLPSRAWAFQERLLSRRLIRFTPSDIIWQCNGETTFEHDFLNRVLSFQSVFRDRYYSNPTARQTTNSEEQQLNNTWAEWSSNLHEYSRRDLTFERDKLPALSGMATSLENKLKGLYLAGIWADHLPYALCWKRQIGQVTSRLMPENTVPSWSWASLSATAVDYYGDRLDDWQLLPEPQRPQILETQTCKISDQAPFGRVNGGSILMEAPLFEASISLERNSTEQPFEVRFRNPDQSFWNLTFYEDCILDTKGGHAVRAIGTGHKERVSGPPESFVKSKAWVVWLAINHEQRWGLVLGKNPQSPDFHRLGILILDTNPKCFRGRRSIRFQLV